MKMKLSELKDKQKNVTIDVKIIYDRMKPIERFGKKIKTVVVVDADSEEGGETALLDLVDEDIERFKFMDKIRVVDGYSKIISTHRDGAVIPQMMIKLGFKNGKFIGRYEKIEDE